LALDTWRHVSKPSQTLQYPTALAVYCQNYTVRLHWIELTVFALPRHLPCGRLGLPLLGLLLLGLLLLCLPTLLLKECRAAFGHLSQYSFGGLLLCRKSGQLLFDGIHNGCRCVVKVLMEVVVAVCWTQR
jgi:hypothetical protein